MNYFKIWLLLLCPYLLGGTNYCPSTITEQYGRHQLSVATAYSEGLKAFEERNYEEATLQWQVVVDAAQDREDYELLYCLYPEMADAYSQIGQFQDAIAASRAFLDLPNAGQDSVWLSSRLSYLSDYYSRISQWESAMRYFLSAKEIAQHTQDTSALIQAYYQGGVLYHFLEDYATAIENYERAVRLAQAADHTGAALACFTALASSAEEMGNLPQALSYAYAGLNTIDDPQMQAYSQQNLGTIYRKMGVYDSASYFLQLAFQNFKVSENAWAQARTLVYLGQLAQDRAQPDSAAYYYRLILDNPAFDGYSLALPAYKGLAQSLEALNEPGSAIQYWKSYIDLQESFYRDTLQLKLDELNAQYELKQQEAEMALLQKEVNITRLRKIQYALGALVLGVIVLALLILNRSIRRNQRILAEKNRQIEHQNQQLQEYNERLKRFNQVVSHDLKQPLRTIQSFVGLLDKRYASHLPEGAQEYMGFIRKNTSQMYELIEGLLSLSELEKQGGPTNHQWIDSRTTAENALHQLQQLILDKDADIRFQPTDHWPKVNGHQAQLTQLWQNLIGNALKFSPKGEVVVTLGCEKRQGQVTFFVRDNGIGISPEDQPRIFQMFSRLHNRRDYEGHGIGLATCKRIVDLHGGRIWVESLVGEGSTFYFSLDPNRIGTPSSTSSLELA